MMVMTKSKMANRYSPEVHASAVRMVFEHQGSSETQAGAIAATAPKIGCIPQTLSGWVKQAEKDSGMRDGATTEERDRIKTLERENRELRQTNEILRKGSAYFRRRNSTAHSSDDRLHRRSKGCLRCRVDLQGAADRAVNILPPIGVLCCSIQSFGPASARRGAASRD
jgi:transposase-like protein